LCSFSSLSLMDPPAGPVFCSVLQGLFFYLSTAGGSTLCPGAPPGLPPDGKLGFPFSVPLFITPSNGTPFRWICPTTFWSHVSLNGFFPIPLSASPGFFGNPDLLRRREGPPLGRLPHHLRSFSWHLDPLVTFFSGHVFAVRFLVFGGVITAPFLLDGYTKSRFLSPHGFGVAAFGKGCNFSLLRFRSPVKRGGPFLPVLSRHPQASQRPPLGSR